MTKINQLKATITKLNLEKGESQAKKLKTKCHNQGERSNKYFLSLLRRKELNGQLTELEIDNRTEKNQTEIENHVVSYYTSLYNQVQTDPTRETSDDLLRLKQQLNDEEIRNANLPITVEKLKTTLLNTQDSCPGQDGIPYSYLRATWEWFGPALASSWEHSVRTNKLPDSHRASWLRLIPKLVKTKRI